MFNILNLENKFAIIFSKDKMLEIMNWENKHYPFSQFKFLKYFLLIDLKRAYRGVENVCIQRIIIA